MVAIRRFVTGTLALSSLGAALEPQLTHGENRMSGLNQDKGLQSLLNRVEGLEKENRRVKKMGVGLLGASVFFALLSAATPMLCKTVWAERLVLRNSSGRDVMAMDAYSGDVPTITMKDEKGTSVVRLSWEDGVLMNFLDQRGEASTSVKVGADGQTTVAHRNDEGDMVSMAD
ncbi:MAG: hypothetical protein ACI8X5_001129 [Planctomycetota bacterium]